MNVPWWSWICFQTLQQSIQSVTKNGRSLLGVAFFGVTLIYLFTLFGFAFFREDYLPEDGMYCDNLLECFGTSKRTALCIDFAAGARKKHVQLLKLAIHYVCLFMPSNDVY